MARQVIRGEIWLYRFASPDKRRPVLVLSRDSLISVLNTVTVVALTSTGHGSSVELELGTGHGLKDVCFANFANLFTVRQSELVKYVGRVNERELRQACSSLAIALGCD